MENFICKIKIKKHVLFPQHPQPDLESITKVQLQLLFQLQVLSFNYNYNYILAYYNATFKCLI